MGKEACHCEPVCVDACPDHVAKASYTAVVGSHTITLLSPETDCNFTGSDCIPDTASVTNDWEVYSGDFVFQDIFACAPCVEEDCCTGYQQPGHERDPATKTLAQAGYEQNDHWKRWEQVRDTVTVQLYDVGGGNLRILVTILKEILYMVGVNTAIRAGYRLANYTYCTPRYTDSGGTDLPQINCTIEYADPVWDDWPSQPDPGYPPCNDATSNPDGCEFSHGTNPTPSYTLDTESIGPLDAVQCVDGTCQAYTYNYTKAVSRVYEQHCTIDMFGHNCFAGVSHDNYRVFGYYYYYSDPFPCDAFPSNPIALKREPYTDIAATTEYETVCGQSFPFRTPAVSKDLTVTIT